MYEILINVLVFSGIILLLALTVAVIQGVLILIDARKTAKEVEEKLRAVVSVFDVVSLIFGGIDGAKKKIQNKFSPNKSTLVALIAGIKRGLQVLVKNKDEKEGEDNGKNI